MSTFSELRASIPSRGEEASTLLKPLVLLEHVKDMLNPLCRWMEVIKSAASSTGRMSLLIPKGCPLEVNGN